MVFDGHARPMRVKPIAEAILRELRSARISPDHVRFIVATGAHGGHEQDRFLKEAWRENFGGVSRLQS